MYYNTKTIRRVSRIQVLGGTPQGKTLFGPMVDTLNKGIQSLEKNMKAVLSEQDTDLWTESEKRAQTRESSPTDSSSSEENTNEPVELRKARYKASEKFQKAGRLLAEFEKEEFKAKLDAERVERLRSDAKLEAERAEKLVLEARNRELEEMLSRMGVLPNKASREGPL